VTARTRIDRVRASVGIAQLALQQIEDELTGEINAVELAQIVRELHHEAAPADGVFGSLAQLLTAAAQTAERLGLDRDGDASCSLHEAAAFVTDNAGLRAHYATRALDPQGERSP
jgi:hypothetical protein